MTDQKQNKVLKEEIINMFGHSFRILEKIAEKNKVYIIKEFIGDSYDTLENCIDTLNRKRKQEISFQIKELEESISSQGFVSKIISKSEIEKIRNRITELNKNYELNHTENIEIEYLSDKYYFYPVLNFNIQDEVFLAVLGEIPELKTGEIQKIKSTIHPHKDNLINIFYDVSVNEKEKNSNFYFYSKPDDLFSKVHLEIINQNGSLSHIYNPQVYIFKDKKEAVKFINSSIEDKIKRLHEAKIPTI